MQSCNSCLQQIPNKVRTMKLFPLCSVFNSSPDSENWQNQVLKDFACFVLGFFLFHSSRKQMSRWATQRLIVRVEKSFFWIPPLPALHKRITTCESNCRSYLQLNFVIPRPPNLRVCLNHLQLSSIYLLVFWLFYAGGIFFSSFFSLIAILLSPLILFCVA